METRQANDLIRKELGAFNVKDLNEFFNKTENLNENGRKNWCGEIDLVKEILYKLIKFSMWLHYEALREYHDDLRKADWVRGGINSIAVLKEYVDEMVAEHASNLQGDEKPEDPNNPLPEPITGEGPETA